MFLVFLLCHEDHNDSAPIGAFAGVVGDCEAYKERAKHGHESHPWGYKPGSKNLFGAMAARIKEALKAAPEGSRLGGVLWYQVRRHMVRVSHPRTCGRGIGLSCKRML